MICIIQARTSSKRFPNKVLKKIKKKTILEHVIEKVLKVFPPNRVVIATSTSRSDLKIVNIAKKKNCLFFCGSLKNVALRFKKILEKFNTNSFIRISADSPLLNSLILKKMVLIFKKNYQKFDIVTNCNPKTFPKGYSVEIFKKTIFLKNFKSIQKSSIYREHVTNFFYNNSKKYKIYNFENKVDLSLLNYCVDTKKDFQKIKYIFKNKKKEQIVY